MEYQISQSNNQSLLQKIQQNEIQRNILEYHLEGDQIHVTENLQFKAEIEQNIIQHFTFMLRIQFFNGVFEEITNFVSTQYQSQYSQSQNLYELWCSQVDIIIYTVNQKFIQAQQELEKIKFEQNQFVTQENFQYYINNITKRQIDQGYMVDEAIKIQMAERDFAKRKAEAESTIKESELFLSWLFSHKEDQLKFEKDLILIEKQWHLDYKTHEEGRKFVQDVNLSQEEIYNQKRWHEGHWSEELKKQMQQANPYFTSLYEKYLSCFKFYLDQYELDQLTINRRKIQELNIEIAQGVAEREFNIAFIKYWSDQRNAELQELTILATKHQVKQLSECHDNLSQQLMNVQFTHNSLQLNVSYTQVQYTRENETHSYTTVSAVNLHKNPLILEFQNAYSFQESEETVQKRQRIGQIEDEIKKYENELLKLENQRQYLKELEKEQQIFKKQKDTQYTQSQQQKDSFTQSFEKMLNQTQVKDYEHLRYGSNSMKYIIGALSRYLVVNRDGFCCNTCKSNKQLHQLDYIYYSDLQKEIAFEIRNLMDSPDDWQISNRERIQNPNQIQVISGGTRFLLNAYILADFRNDDGRRQIQNGGLRDFNAHGSIVRTINELCQLVVADYKLDENLEQLANKHFEKWKKYIQQAKEGEFGANYISMDQ